MREGKHRVWVWLLALCVTMGVCVDVREALGLRSRFSRKTGGRQRMESFNFKARMATRKFHSSEGEEMEGIIKWATKDVSRYMEMNIEKIKETMATSSRRDNLIKTYRQTFMNTIETTVQATYEGRTFVITGDIDAMWLRDSAPQVEHYLRCCANHSVHVRKMLVGLVNEHAFLALQDPYANSFYDPPNFKDTRKIYRRGGYIATGNYELDSFAYSIRLAYQLWRVSGESHHFDELFRAACKLMLSIWRKEQYHEEASTYEYNPKELKMKNGRENSESGYTGMTWTGFRPSDSPCQYHYHIPDNMLTSVSLGYLSEISREIYGDELMAKDAEALKAGIDSGIEKYGIVNDRRNGRIYAYEVDGLGNALLQDDANIPSLLSMPYLNYTVGDMQVYKNTVDFLWSPANPWFFSGKVAEGVGSSHTGKNKIWHLSLIMKGMMADTSQERVKMLRACLDTDAGTGLMHESFDPSSPRSYTRRWFAWANSMFATWVSDMVEQNTLPSSL
mmetsp:Transcript_13496/g.38351  ORF Transcript_13496/g.38351 Transcript_13496/m.38351 type:complete len:504 (+) Transcript_13496:170-1681(+)